MHNVCVCVFLAAPLVIVIFMCAYFGTSLFIKQILLNFILALQCKHVPTATDTVAAMEKLLDVMRGSCLIRYLKCSERKVHSYFFAGLLVCNATA
jgi:hypothetical protein